MMPNRGTGLRLGWLLFRIVSKFFDR